MGVQAQYPYPLRVLIGVSQLINAIAGRDPDQTTSCHLGLQARKYGGTIPWNRPLNSMIYRWLERIDPGHCERAITNDEVTP